MVDDRELLFFNDAVRAGAGVQPRFASHGTASDMESLCN
jgi:hypothetical protein